MIFKRVRQNEVSNGTMLGVVLIVLAAVIGIGFGVFSITKKVSTEGIANVQDSLLLVQDSSFDDYDNKIVTGAQLQAAYKKFQGKATAILVNTVAMDIGVVTNAEHIVYSYAIGGQAYINYNALLASTADGKGTKIEKGGAMVKEDLTPKAACTLLDKAPYIITDNGFAINDDGKVLFDDNIGGWINSGTCEYIPLNAKFEAHVIKDVSGTKVGVAFRQLISYDVASVGDEIDTTGDESTELDEPELTFNFEPYDNKSGVTYEQLQTAYSSLKDSPVGILIHTTDMTKQKKTYAKHTVFWNGDIAYVNYNALLALQVENDFQYGTIIDENELVNETVIDAAVFSIDANFVEGMLYTGAEVDFCKNNFDFETKGWETKDSCEYLSSDFTFYTLLCKDSFGKVIGILFTQENNEEESGDESEINFENYNDKRVKGEEIISVYDKLEGKSYAILVNTVAMNENKKSIYPAEGSGVYVCCIGDTYSDTTDLYINYNAVLGLGNNNSCFSGLRSEVKVLSTYITDHQDVFNETLPILKKQQDLDSLFTANGLAKNFGGEYTFADCINGWYETECCEYINPTAYFVANLIKDTSGKVIGITFAALR